ncbi:pro-epidermal growth factor [Arapaima gigas]
MLFAVLTVLLLRLAGARKVACGKEQQSAAGNWSCVGEYPKTTLSLLFTPYLIFSHGPAIFRIDTDGARQSRIVGSAGASILLDFHYTDQTVYWVNVESGVIRKAPLNGTRRQKVHTAGRGIAGFAVDWIHNQAIWTNRDKGTIERVALSGINPKTILANLSRPGSIAVDPNDRFIFWVSDNVVPSIQRTNLDGKTTMTTLKTADRIGSLAMDFADKRLFWVQLSLDGKTAVGSCDYDGNTVNIIRQVLHSRISAIAVFLEHLYYTDTRAGAIIRVNKYTGEERMNVTSKNRPRHPINVKVVHPLMQPMAEALPTTMKGQNGGCDTAEADCASACSSHVDAGVCRCSAGYVLSRHGNYCTDVNECALWNHGCTLGCVNIPGSYFCTCPRGFALLPDRKTCRELVPCSTDASHCQHGCVRSEDGEACACPEDSVLQPDGMSCTGCSQLDNGGCSQVCVDLGPGRWECECRPGFQLQPDGRRCSATGKSHSYPQSTGPPPYLIYSNAVGIRRIDLDGTGDRSLVEAAGGTILAVDYDPVEGKVYFANTALLRIERAKLDGSGQVEVLVSEGLDLPEGVAVDWINRKLYWTDRGLSAIQHSDLNGLNRQVVIAHDLHRPRGIALHPEAKKLFWTDVGERPAVESASLDGSDRRVVVSTGLLSPSGLSLDHAEGRLYWCDSKTGLIELASLDGSQRRVLAQNQVGRPFDIAVFEDLVWVTDWDQYLLKLDKRTGRNLERVRGRVGRGASLVVVHPLAKPGADACLYKNGGCDQLCESRFGVARCSCHSNFIKSTYDGTCLPANVTAPPQEFQDKETPDTSASKNETLNDEGAPSTALESESAMEKEEVEFTMVTEEMVSDQDDCASLRCDANARCVLDRGTSRCQCRVGFTAAGEKCVETDECQLGTHDCNPYAECLNTEGHYLCRCLPGYSGTGFECQKTPSTVQWTTTRTPTELTTQGHSHGAMEECPASHDSYCLHEGVCFYVPDIESFACKQVPGCQPGYLGERCQHRDLQWWDLQHREREKRRSLAVAACVAVLITLLSAAACAAYCYGSKWISKKQMAADDLSGSEGRSSKTTGSSTPQVCVVLGDGTAGQGGEVFQAAGTPRGAVCPSCSSETGESVVAEEAGPVASEAPLDRTSPGSHRTGIHHR